MQESTALFGTCNDKVHADAHVSADNNTYSRMAARQSRAKNLHVCGGVTLYGQQCVRFTLVIGDLHTKNWPEVALRIKANTLSFWSTTRHQVNQCKKIPAVAFAEANTRSKSRRALLMSEVLLIFMRKQAVRVNVPFFLEQPENN